MHVIGDVLIYQLLHVFMYFYWKTKPNLTINCKPNFDTKAWEESAQRNFYIWYIVVAQRGDIFECKKKYSTKEHLASHWRIRHSIVLEIFRFINKKLFSPQRVFICSVPVHVCLFPSFVYCFFFVFNLFSWIAQSKNLAGFEKEASCVIIEQQRSRFYYHKRWTLFL